MEQHILQLQETVAHQGAEIAQLSDELYAQQKETAELSRQIRRLSKQLQSLTHHQSDAADGSPEPPPPHY